MIPPAWAEVMVDSGKACELIICLLLFLPALWVFMTLLPTLMLNSEKRDVPLGTRDYIGWTLWGLGFATEALADQQKWLFKRDPNNAVSEWPFLLHRFTMRDLFSAFVHPSIHPGAGGSYPSCHQGKGEGAHWESRSVVFTPSATL